MIPLIILAIENPDDRTFMEDVYTSNMELMYSRINQIVKDRCEVEDIMQSAVVKLVDNLSSWKVLGEKQMLSYIITTCKHEAFSYLRKAKRLVYVENGDLEDLVVNTYACPETVLLDKEDRKNMYQALNRLDERNRLILESKYILMRSDAEIAEEMDVKPSSVRMMLTRAREKLQKKYEEVCKESLRH